MLFKSFIPFCHAKNIYDIEPSFFRKNGVKVLFIDLDNTLDSFKAFHPKQRTIDFVKSIKEEGIEPVIVSNNKGKRVSSFANDCNVKYVSSARKPFGTRIREQMARYGLKENEVMLVGDQMMTDVLAAKNAGIRVVLTEKIVKEDQWTTHINRLIDRPIRKYHSKRGNLKDWRTV